MSTTSLFNILSEVRGPKLTKVAQIDRVIDWAPVRAVIETVYTKGSAPTGRPSYDGLMLFKIEMLRGTWGWSKRMRSTSWRPSPTTCTEPQGSLWPTPKKNERKA